MTPPPSPAGRLGFGCAHLPGRLGAEGARALVAAAYDCGVRHFDVARMYGDGQAEALLGQALRGRQDAAIITKAGILPASRSLAARAWRSIERAAPVLAAAPRPLRSWATPRFGAFSPQEVRASVETSLRELGVSHVGALLLHECALAHVTDALKAELRALKSAGKISAWGLASAAATAAPVMAAHPDLCGIVQYEAGAKLPRQAGGRVILHSALGARFHGLLSAFAGDKGMAARFQSAVGVDAKDRAAIAALLLHDALARADLVLFSSTSAEHIRTNVERAALPPPPELAAFQAFLAAQT